MSIYTRVLVVAVLTSTTLLAAVPKSFEDDKDKCLRCSTPSVRPIGYRSSPPDGHLYAVSSKKEQKQIVALLTQGLKAASRIDNAFLDWIHPQMKQYFRDYYLRATPCSLKAIEKGIPRSSSRRMR